MCIKNCIEYTSHGLLVSRNVVHNRFMDLGNPSKTIVHYLLIGGITCLSRQDGFPMVSALVHVMNTALGLR